MKLILRVVQSEALEGHYNSSYASVELGPEDAVKMGKRLKQWAAIRAEDEDLYGMSFWDWKLEVFGHCDEMEDISDDADDFEFIKAPDDLEIPEDMFSRIECDQMVISGSLDSSCSIHWKGYLKHTGMVVETTNISLGDICEMLAVPSEVPAASQIEDSEQQETEADPLDIFNELVDSVFAKISG